MGGAVLAVYKKLDKDITQWTAEKVAQDLYNSLGFRKTLWNTPLGKEIREIPEAKGFFNFIMRNVVTGLSGWSKEDGKLTTIEIKKTLVLLEEHKAKQK